MTVELRSLSFAADGRRVVRYQNGIQVGIAWFSFPAATATAVVVGDRSQTLTVRNRRIVRAREVYEERLIRLLFRIAADSDDNRRRLHLRCKTAVSIGGQVIAVGHLGRAVSAGKIDG